MNFRVTWDKDVNKQLDRIPSYLRTKFIAWALVVEGVGILEARKMKGFHDEPLKGQRKGQRSIRLNRAYRAIYVEKSSGELQIIDVIEVSKHEY